jgi:hypothetical protein
VGLVGILGFVAGFLFWGSNFTRSTVTSQLAIQQITFPTANSAAIKALPASDASAMRQYAGEKMTTGDQAEVWADDFIAVHLHDMGMTYSQASAAAQANPGNAKLASLEATIFQGTTLRSMLLNAYGWWTIGSYALFAGIGLAIAAFVVLLALGFELWRWAVAVPEVNPEAAAVRAPSRSVADHGVARFTQHDKS